MQFIFTKNNIKLLLKINKKLICGVKKKCFYVICTIFLQLNIECCVSVIFEQIKFYCRFLLKSIAFIELNFSTRNMFIANMHVLTACSVTCDF